MARLEGSERLALPVAAAAARLSDAAFLAACVPEAHVSVATPDRAVLDVPPRLTAMAGRVAVELEVTERTADRAAFRVVNKATGASATVAATLAFAADGDGTAVRWTAEIERVTGLLRIAPRSVLQAAMQKVVGLVWDRVRERIAAAPGS